jgi:hypothetical protein
LKDELRVEIKDELVKEIGEELRAEIKLERKRARGSSSGSDSSDSDGDSSSEDQFTVEGDGEETRTKLGENTEDQISALRKDEFPDYDDGTVKGTIEANNASSKRG